MRWEELFDDLEAQIEAGSRRDLDAEVADRIRRERAAVPLTQRLAGLAGSVVDLRILGGLGGPGGLGGVSGASLTGELVEVGADWVLLRESAPQLDAAVPMGRPSLVPLSALLSIATPARGNPSWTDSNQARIRVSHAAGASSPLTRRFGFGYALRALSRDRAPVRLSEVTGQSYAGTIDGVGADALDLSEHPVDLPPRPENVVRRRIIAFSAIAVVRREWDG